MQQEKSFKNLLVGKKSKTLIIIALEVRLWVFFWYLSVIFCTFSASYNDHMLLFLAHAYFFLISNNKTKQAPSGRDHY